MSIPLLCLVPVVAVALTVGLYFAVCVPRYTRSHAASAFAKALSGMVMAVPACIFLSLGGWLSQLSQEQLPWLIGWLSAA